MSEELSLGQETLRHRLHDIPDNVKAHVRMGFHLLSRVEKERRDTFLGYMLAITEEGDGLDKQKAIDLSGLDGNTIADALSAIALTIGSVIDIDVSSEDFVRFGVNSVFDESDGGTADDVAQQVISKKSSLNQGIKESALADSVLPSFQGFDFEVDVRLAFKKDEESPTGGVAVAVCNLRTDATDDRWFQMSIKDAQSLRNKIDRAVKKLEGAEQFISKASL